MREAWLAGAGEDIRVDIDVEFAFQEPDQACLGKETEAEAAKLIESASFVADGEPRDDAGDAAQRTDSLHRVACARVMGWPGARDEVWDPSSVCVPGRFVLESLDSLRKRMYTDEDWDSLGTRSLGRGGCWRVHAGVRHAPSDSAQAESANARVRPVALLALH